MDPVIQGDLVPDGNADRVWIVDPEGVYHLSLLVRDLALIVHILHSKFRHLGPLWSENLSIGEIAHSR